LWRRSGSGRRSTEGESMRRIGQFGLVRYADDGRYGTAYVFWCPGCKGHHQFQVRTDGQGPSWTFDGNLSSPTFAPSLLYDGSRPESRCHLFLRNGQLEFLGDCFHDLKGKTVPLPEDPQPWPNPEAEG
jgi:hypothetical protein